MVETGLKPNLSKKLDINRNSSGECEDWGSLCLETRSRVNKGGCTQDKTNSPLWTMVKDQLWSEEIDNQNFIEMFMILFPFQEGS